MEISISRKTIAPHLLRLMTAAHARGRKVTLDELTRRLGVRRADVRNTLSDLHREGHLDVQRMRLTLSGFSIGLALLKTEPRPLRLFKRSVAAA